MKNFKSLLIAASIALVSLPAAAQFSIGPHLGVNVNTLRFNKSVVNSENRAGFTGGLKMEFMIPKTNIGLDASVMYVHRSKQYQNASNEFVRESKDYVEVPVNLKWKIGIPVIGKIITPYIFTGPSFYFMTGKKEIHDSLSYKSTDIVWNVGAGVQLFRHLQISAYYGFGMNDTFSSSQSYDNGKNRSWTMSTAWLF